MAEDLKKEIEGLRALPVALVGQEKSSFDIFHVLQELKLARPLIATEEEKLKTKPKNPEEKSERKSPNHIKDKDSGKVYVVDNKPSIIISITGDAQDLPEDHDLTLAVDNLISFFETEKQKNTLLECLALNRESACRALLYNVILNGVEAAFEEASKEEASKEEASKGGKKPTEDKSFGQELATNKCLKISYLLQKRIKELSTKFADVPNFKEMFACPSVKDVLLDVTKAVDKLMSDEKKWDAKNKKFKNDFLELPDWGPDGVARNLHREPNACGKRLSKARLEKFFDGGVMGAALKVAGSNSSAWIIDGGTNGGVMKLAGKSRQRLRGGSNAPLIGVAVAMAADNKGKVSEKYETNGHTHMVLAVDRNGNPPLKPPKKGEDSKEAKPFFGYEIEYTKFLEDSLSRIFSVPIVGVLIGGGPGSLQNVVEAIEGDFPVVVIKGTGRVADLICAIREHESMSFVENQCKVFNVKFERLKKCSAYPNLHILDLNWEQCDTFVDFVESIVRANSISKQKTKQYRSSNLLELCSLLDENKHPPLQLVQGDHALWSLTFGIAQVDEIELPFVRIFTLREDLKSNFPVIKLAEAVISIMRQMFPLPVALISTIAPTPSSPSLHESVLKDLEGWLNSIAPFCLWSMRSQMENFEICVHVCNEPVSAKKLEPREIKFVLKGVVGDTLELQNTISNRLHQEYGIPSIAFAEAPDKADGRHAPVGQDSTQETKPSHFLEAIWSSCLQSTKVLLKIADKPSRAKEVFLLEQVLNDFSVYREVVADFFLALKDELQQRIHGEDADELCRTTYERIKCSSPVSLPLYFFRMQSKSLQRVIKYLPDFFLCSNHVVEAEFSCLQLGLIQQESASIIVQQYEHDYDFPVFGTEREELRQQAWTTYFEYLYLNCGDDRPYSPCWDPIALQEKAARVFEVISSTQPNILLYKKKLTDVYDSFRTAVIESLKREMWTGNNEYTIWECIQETKGYTFHDTIVLLNRLECGLKKVFYFLFCCKSIVFCEGCMKEFGLNPKSDAKQPYALKCSNYGSKFCQIRTKLKYPSYNGTLHTRNSSALKEFCFNWYIKVGLNLKKVCSTALLRQHALPEDTGENAEKRPQGINFSYSRDKLGVPKMQNDERSKLRNVFVDVVEHCRSESLMLLEEGSDKQKSQILDLITIADSVNRVVAECDLLKTGCSVYERFPKVDPIGVSSTNSGSNTLPTHLIVAAVEGNAAKASAYIARADLDYISNLCMNTNDHDARRFGDAYVSSCALHLALERGNTDVANIIISRIASLACEEYFDWYPYPKKTKEIFLDRLFIGTSPGTTTGEQIYRDTDNNQEIPTNFMYLARYAMIPAMDTVLNILGNLKMAEAIQTDISKYIVNQHDSNGLNALHYAILSQSPQCVSWFLPYMHDFLVCHSSSKFTFCPELFGKRKPEKKNTLVFESFKSGYMKLLRMHPPSDFTDSDCRLSISEDWIQTYHFSYDGSLGLAKKSDASRNHQEMSPYELALLVWRLADVESALLQESLHNIATNVQKLKQEGDSPKPEEARGCMRCVKTNSVAAIGDVQAKNSESVSVAVSADSVVDSKKASADEDDALPERLAESYKQRSTALYKILTNLEEAAEAEVDIDAKKKKGLKQLAAYRNHRAMSRLVFPGMSYLIYVFFATLMAIIMTNGLFDEPAKFTHAVVAELGGAVKISNYNDLTVFWKTLAGFLWGSSPMALRFATYNLLGPVLMRQIRTARSSCNSGQAYCAPSNYRSITFSADPNAPYPTPLFYEFSDMKEPFSFSDNEGKAYTLPFTENVVQPQWGNEYYYSGGGYVMTFSCPTNQSVSSHCGNQQNTAHVTCNCSQTFERLVPPSTADESSSTFFDDATRALDVSFLVFSPTLQSYVFVHLLFEFSETGAVSVWDDYQSFSGRYSKQFDFSERMTTLRIAQYVTIIYALMYLFYERTDWNVLRDKIPERLISSKSKRYKTAKEDLWTNISPRDPIGCIAPILNWIRFYLTFQVQSFICHWELFLNKSEYYGKIYQLLELIGLICGYSVIVLDLVLQSRLRALFTLASSGKFNDPGSITPSQGMGMHAAISHAHTLLATEREVIGAYMFFTWTRVFAYLVHMPGWGPYLHAIIATIFSGVVLAFVLVVVLLNAAFTIMMYCSYSLTGGDELRTLEDSFFSNWRMLFGLNELFKFVENNRGLNGPKFSKGSSGVAFFFISLLGNLIVMNIVVGLLSEQYQKFSKLSVLHFNRELNANLAKDIIAVKSSEGLNPFGFSLRFPFPTRVQKENEKGSEWKWASYRMNIGATFLNNWKMEAKSHFVLKMMLMLEGYYFPDWVTSHWPFRFTRLNSPAALFRLKWFHGGVAQERIVCKKLLKFLNLSTTPIGIVAASEREFQQSEQKRLEASASSGKHK